MTVTGRQNLLSTCCLLVGVSNIFVLQAAFSQVAGSLGPPQLGQGSSTAGAGPSTAPAAAVVDLGIVGRGTKRVTPVPLPTGAAGWCLDYTCDTFFSGSQM